MTDYQQPKLNWQASDLFHLADANRIDGNMQALAEQLTAAGYPVTVNGKTWQAGQSFTVADLNRLKTNLASLAAGFYSDSVPLPTISQENIQYFSVAEIQPLESGPYAIYTNLQNMIAAYWLCGACICGEEVNIP